MGKKFESLKTIPTAFVSLADISILNGVKIPKSITDVTLWYKKEGNDFWGLTAKAFDSEDDISQNKFSVKVSWCYKESEDSLIPTKASEEFTEVISGELLAKLKEIKENHQTKQNRRKVQRVHKDDKLSVSSKN